MSHRRQRYRNSIRLDVQRQNDEEVIICVNVINDRLWRRSVDYRDGTLTFRIIAQDLETGRRNIRPYYRYKSFATDTIEVDHGSAYFFTCKVFSDTKFNPIAETSRYYHTYQDPIIENGMPDAFRVEQVELLKKTAIAVVRNENSQPFPAKFLFRNNHPEYFEDIQQKGNMMQVSPKNPSGNVRCPIINKLQGVEFNVGSRNLPRKSPFGDTRIVIPSQRLINPFLYGLYFCDLYCYGKGHQVLLVVTRSGSPVDKFCAQRLPRLPWIPNNPDFENPFLFYDQQTGILHVTFAVWVSVFYTENVRIDESTDFFEHGFGRRTVGYGKPKEESCIICNLSLIPRSELKFCFDPNCLVCSCINHAGFIESTTNGEIFACLSNACCQIRNLIYVIECGECGKQYVGQTQRTLRQRILEHINDINHGCRTFLGRHINSHDNWNFEDPNISIWVLEIVHQLPENNSDLSLAMRRTKETQWISKLGTAWPYGLNIQS